MGIYLTQITLSKTFVMTSIVHGKVMNMNATKKYLKKIIKNCWIAKPMMEAIIRLISFWRWIDLSGLKLLTLNLIKSMLLLSNALSNANVWELLPLSIGHQQ